MARQKRQAGSNQREEGEDEVSESAALSVTVEKNYK